MRSTTDTTIEQPPRHAVTNGSDYPHRTRRRHQGLSHRRSGNPRALRHSPRHRQGRVRLDRRVRRVAASRLCSPSWACSIRPTAGSYTLKGQPGRESLVSERARIRNREIGFIFQSFNLIGDLTVFENVELPLTYRGMGASERKTFVVEALERVGMAPSRQALPEPALRRSAAARRRRPRARRQAGRAAGRRADGQSRLAQR